MSNDHMTNLHFIIIIVAKGICIQIKYQMILLIFFKLMYDEIYSRCLKHLRKLQIRFLLKKYSLGYYQWVFCHYETVGGDRFVSINEFLYSLKRFRFDIGIILDIRVV